MSIDDDPALSTSAFSPPRRSPAKPAHIARRRFLDRSSFTVGFKGPQDYLTEVDGEIERADRHATARGVPRGRVHRRGGRGPGRPSPARRSGSSTRSTAPRISPAARRISASRSPPSSAREVEIGVIYDPMVDELFAARRGAGATLNGAAMRAATTTDLKAATDRGRLEHAHRRRSFLGIVGPRSSTQARRWCARGSGALGLAYVAAGRRDGYVENHINAWDCLAGIALIREAGGYVSDFLAGDGSAQGQSAGRLRAWRQGRAGSRSPRSTGLVL